jgi:hypothetical protein
MDGHDYVERTQLDAALRALADAQHRHDVDQRTIEWLQGHVHLDEPVSDDERVGGTDD